MITDHLQASLQPLADHVSRVAVSMHALENLTVATSTLQLAGSTPATHGAVLAAHLAVTGSNVTIDAACPNPGEAPPSAPGSVAGLRLWRPLFISPAALLAAVWLATALGGIESELAGLALVPAAVGSLLAHVFGTLESADRRWLWAHFVLLVCTWLGSWTVRRFVVGDWILSLLLSLVVAPSLAWGFTRLLRVREHLRRQQRLELSRIAPNLFIASLLMAGAMLYITIGGLGCALADHTSAEVKQRECAGRVFGQAILAFHIGLVYVSPLCNPPLLGMFGPIKLRICRILF